MAARQPITECTSNTVDEYKKCVAKLPPRSKAADPGKVQDIQDAEAEKERQRNREEAAQAQKQLDEANAALTKIDMEQAKIRQQEAERDRCLHRLKLGSSATNALKCGHPDHVNHDRLGDDQWVYPGGTYVYVNGANRIANVQWTD